MATTYNANDDDFVTDIAHHDDVTEDINDDDDDDDDITTAYRNNYCSINDGDDHNVASVDQKMVHIWNTTFQHDVWTGRNKKLCSKKVQNYSPCCLYRDLETSTSWGTVRGPLHSEGRRFHL